MDECLTERFMVVDGFLPLDHARSMREDVDDHFSNPHRHRPDVHQVWNYWHVPGSYTYLRTTPEKVIAREKVQAFVDALRTWAATNLGLAMVTWPYLSLYVPGCEQGIHNDSVNGRLGFVYSLTRDDRQTIGGETVLFHDHDLFRSALDRPAAGTDLFELVEPRFNRLTLFDDRIPHAVQRIAGSMNPLEGRFVLHGHISEGGIVGQGALSPEAMAEPVATALAELRDEAAGARGTIVYFIEIGEDGAVQRMRPILDRLASPTPMDLDAVRGAIADRIRALRFPASAGQTRANVPLVF